MAPYRQEIGYDAFNNITLRNTYLENGTSERGYNAAFTNHRKTSGGYENSQDAHDAAGNVTQNNIVANGINRRTWTFDAGRNR